MDNFLHHINFDIGLFIPRLPLAVQFVDKGDQVYNYVKNEMTNLISFVVDSIATIGLILVAIFCSLLLINWSVTLIRLFNQVRVWQSSNMYLLEYF